MRLQNFCFATVRAVIAAVGLGAANPAYAADNQHQAEDDQIAFAGMDLK